MKSDDVIKELKSHGDPVRAAFSAGFFKTGKGQYGEGDIFLGLTVPLQRSIAKKYKALSLAEVKKLLSNPIHECRLTALEILVFKYEGGTKEEQGKVFDFYIKNKKFVNNWDLVDASARYIAGEWLMDKDKGILYTLAVSKSLWDRRIAIVATHAFIGKGKLDDTFKIAALLLEDTQDLMHKAAGWMLREAGKKSEAKLDAFLKKHLKSMPRTMLRYAIEKFPEEKRQYYLKG